MGGGGAGASGATTVVGSRGLVQRGIPVPPTKPRAPPLLPRGVRPGMPLRGILSAALGPESAHILESGSLYSALKALKTSGGLEKLLRGFAPERVNPQAPLERPAFRRRSMDTALKHINALGIRSGYDQAGGGPASTSREEGGGGGASGEAQAANEEVQGSSPPASAPFEVALYGDGLVEKLTAASHAEHAGRLGVPKRVALLAVGGDGAEHLVLRLHLYTACQRTSVRARSHCIMIGINNVLAAFGLSEFGKIDRSAGNTLVGENPLMSAAHPVQIARAIQHAVDLINAAEAKAATDGRGEGMKHPKRGRHDGEEDGEDEEDAFAAMSYTAEASSSSSSSPVFVCRLLHVYGNQPWVAEANKRIDAVNWLLAESLDGATLLKTWVPKEAKYFEIDGLVRCPPSLAVSPRFYCLSRLGRLTPMPRTLPMIFPGI